MSGQEVRYLYNSKRESDFYLPNLHVSRLNPDLASIGQLAHIAGNVIERLRARESLARALAEVRASEERVYNIINTVPGFVWSAGPDGGANFINQYWHDYTGIESKDSLGDRWAEVVHPAEAEATFAWWQSTVQSGRAGSIEYRLRRFDGSYRCFLARVVPQRNPATGEIERWHGASIDIEDRKQDEILRTGEKQVLGLMADRQPLSSVLAEICRLVEFILEGAMCGIMLVDAWQARASHAGAKELRLQVGAGGHLPVGLVERTLQPAADGEASPVAMAVLGKVHVVSIDLARETRWQAWCSAARAEGIGAICATPLLATDGAVVGVLSLLYRHAIVLDQARKNVIERSARLAGIAIERARSDAALKQGEAFLAKAQQLSHTGTVHWRMATDEMVWSDEIYRIFEIDPATPPSFEVVYTRIHPEDIPFHVDAIRSRRQLGGSFEYKHRLLFLDGRMKWVRLVAHAYRSEEDGGLEYIIALQDVTQHHLAEKALGQARAELAHVARVATLGTLTASIAHEVNQPLAGIITNASTCLRMLAASPPNVEGACETIRRTVRDGHRASDVIERLRSMFAKKQAAVESVDLNAAAREVIAMLQGELQRGAVTLYPEFADDLPAVTGDRVQLQQVILNLVSNAADAMSEIVGRQRRMTLRTVRESNERVRLDVVDAGCGLAKENVDELFNAFYTTKDHGMGIGLSISRSIIETHQGRLWATANEDHGATFSFSLPCRDGPAPGADALLTVQAPAGSPSD